MAAVQRSGTVTGQSLPLRTPGRQSIDQASDRAVFAVRGRILSRRTARLASLPGEMAARASGQTSFARMAGNDVSQKPARSYIRRPTAVAINSARRMPSSRAHPMTESKAIWP